VLKKIVRLVGGIVFVLLAMGFLKGGLDLIVSGKDFWNWGPYVGLGLPMFFGGVGLILNWFDKDDFIYWPF